MLVDTTSPGVHSGVWLRNQELAFRAREKPRLCCVTDGRLAPLVDCSGKSLNSSEPCPIFVLTEGRFLVFAHAHDDLTTIASCAAIAQQGALLKRRSRDAETDKTAKNLVACVGISGCLGVRRSKMSHNPSYARV